MTSGKNSNWIEKLIEECKNDPTAADRHVLVYGCPSPEQPRVPDLLSAYRLFVHGRDWSYSRVIAEFRLRNPIMYFLWYRWWFYFSVPKELRGIVFRLSNVSKTYRTHAPYWVAFMQYHPVLFLIWLVLYALFQLFVKTLTAPVEIWRKFVYPKSPLLKRVESGSIDHEFIEEDSQVP